MYVALLCLAQRYYVHNYSSPGVIWLGVSTHERDEKVKCYEHADKREVINGILDDIHWWRWFWDLCLENRRTLVSKSSFHKIYFDRTSNERVVPASLKVLKNQIPKSYDETKILKKSQKLDYSGFYHLVLWHYLAGNTDWNYLQYFSLLKVMIGIRLLWTHDNQFEICNGQWRHIMLKTLDEKATYEIFNFDRKKLLNILCKDAKWCIFLKERELQLPKYWNVSSWY